MKNAAAVGPDVPDEPLGGQWGGHGHGYQPIRDAEVGQAEAQSGIVSQSQQTLSVTLTTALRCSRFAGQDWNG